MMNVMQRLGYYNFYTWVTRDGTKGLEKTNKAGWWTHTASRPIMLNELRTIFLDIVNNRLPQQGAFRDISLIDEMRTFSTNPRSGKAEANVGCHDDRVIAIAIANRVASDEVYCTKNDLIYAKSQMAKPRKVIDQAALVTRAKDPDKVIASIMGSRSNFMKNKWEI